jgi:hypothetical protein
MGGRGKRRFGIRLKPDDRLRESQQRALTLAGHRD